MSNPNIYHLRRVAATAAKPCYVCYKPTSSCLITPDNRDFFYVCDGHLKDPGFAKPIVDEGEQERKKEEAMAKAIEEVKKEYEEKQKAKQKKKDKKDDEKKKEDTKDEKERDEKIKAIETKSADTPKADEPRIFALHKSILQMRVAKLQNAQRAKKQAELLKKPTTFPSVPTGDL